MIQLFGALLITAGLVVIIFGSKNVQSGGTRLTFFRMPKPHLIAVKWVSGLLCIWFGVFMLVTATVP